MRSIVRVAFVVALLLLAVAWPAAAHAELVSSDPSDGQVLTASPTAVTAVYSEKIDPARSSITVRDAAGAIIAKGGVDPSDPKQITMRVDLPTPLPPGIYEVRWTTVTSNDDAVLRGTFHFTVGPSPSASGTPVVPATPPSSAGPSAAPTVSPAHPPTSAPSAASSATPAPGTSGGTATSGGDALLPVLVAGGLVAVVAAALLLRRRAAAGPMP